MKEAAGREDAISEDDALSVRKDLIVMKPVRITRENSTYQVLHALKSNRHKRRQLGEVFVEGVAPIKSVLAVGLPVRRLIFADAGELSGWAREVIARCTDCQLISLDRRLFAQLSDRESPSELLMTVAIEEGSIEAISLDREPFLLVIDRPTNHGNLGAIIRSADAFGVDLIMTTGHGVDPYDPAVIRASMGAIFRMPVVHVESVQSFVAWLDGLRESYPCLSVLGTDSGGSVPLTDISEMSRPVAVVLGNEAKGLSVSLRTVVDQMVRIPMTGHVDSLNVACAASIILYQIFASSREMR